MPEPETKSGDHHTSYSGPAATITLTLTLCQHNRWHLKVPQGPDEHPNDSVHPQRIAIGTNQGEREHLVFYTEAAATVAHTHVPHSLALTDADAATVFTLAPHPAEK